MKRRVRVFTAHAVLVLGTAFLILVVVEWIFPFLNFVESEAGHWLLLLLCLMAIHSGWILRSALYKRKPKENEKRTA